MIHKIYGLVDPRDGRIRYVGQTLMPLATRLHDHIRKAVRGIPKHSGKTQWLLGLIANGLMPTITLLEECDRDWREAEREWIGRYADLFNAKRGGGGGHPTRLKGLPQSTIDRLGKVPDIDLAAELGVTRKAITYHRRKLGIAASFDRTRNPPPPIGRKFEAKELPAACLARLGTMPDYLLSREYGVSKRTVLRRRHAAGIPSYAKTTGHTGRIKSGEPHRRWSK